MPPPRWLPRLSDPEERPRSCTPSHGLGDEFPRGRGPGAGERMTEPRGPSSFVVEVVAPRMGRRRQAVEVMLVGDPDGPVNLVGDRTSPTDRRRDHNSGGRYSRFASIRSEDTDRLLEHRRTGGDLSGEDGDLLLHGLEASDGTTELDAFVGMPDGRLQHSLERADGLCRATERAAQT